MRLTWLLRCKQKDHKAFSNGDAPTGQPYQQLQLPTQAQQQLQPQQQQQPQDQQLQQQEQQQQQGTGAGQPRAPRTRTNVALQAIMKRNSAMQEAKQVKAIPVVFGGIIYRLEFCWRTNFVKNAKILLIIYILVCKNFNFVLNYPYDFFLTNILANFI